MLGFLGLGQFDVQKAILEERPHAAAIHRTGDDDPPLKRAIIDFHLAERTALLAAGIFPMAPHQQQAVVQGDFEIVLLDDPACTELLSTFIVEHPDLWNEDIGL